MDNAIETKQDKLKRMLIEQIKKTPIILIACEKVGIGRASYYRWKKEDEEFALNAEDALLEGKLLINDMAESQLISEIKNKNMTAIIYWLKHNHPSFSTRVEIIAGKKDYELSDEEKAMLEKALELSSLIPKKEGEEVKNG
ncbi:MAG: hypothetical protein V1697_01845 [Candidatus Levyibacteriota bacterium]